MEGKLSLKEQSEFIIEDDFLEDDIEEFEDHIPSGGFDEKKKGVSAKRSSSGSGGGMSSPSCQVEKCGVDLSEAKRYHRRHKVCETHSKAPAVLVSGVRQRFCQQCSRFHELLEFDDAKRSCRRRLAGHNERRRKSSDGEGSNRKGSIQYRQGDDQRGKFQITIPTQPGNSTFKRSQIR